MHSSTFQTIVSHVARYTLDTRKIYVLSVKLQLRNCVIMNYITKSFHQMY